MREEDIRAGLAAKVAPAPEPTTVESSAPTAPLETGYTAHIANEMIEAKFFDYYQVEPAQRLTDAKPKLQYLIEWAKRQTGSNDDLVIMQHLKQFDSVFMLPGPRKLEAIYQYVKLEEQKERLLRGIEIYGTI